MSLFNQTPEKTPLFETKEFKKPILSKIEKALKEKELYKEHIARQKEQAKEREVAFNAFMDSFVNDLQKSLLEVKILQRRYNCLWIDVNSKHFFDIYFVDSENCFSIIIEKDYEILSESPSNLLAIRTLQNHSF